jgi:hypothetical protein
LPHLRVGKSRVRFSDLDRPEPFVANITPIEFQLTDFTTFMAVRKPLTASRRASSMAHSISLAGHPRKPHRRRRPVSSASTDLPLPRIAAYLGDALPLDIARGSLAVRGRYQYAEAADGPQVDTRRHRTHRSRALHLRARGREADYVVLDSLQLPVAVELSLAAAPTGVLPRWPSMEGRCRRGCRRMAS